MTNSVRVIMSPPDYFDIEYSINPWMDIHNKVHPQHAREEWQSLRNTYKDLGLETLIIPPVKGLPDLVFTTDHGTWIGDTFYLSNFRYPERQKEQDVVSTWYKDQGIKVQTTPTTCFMEGGDVLVHDHNIYIGHGFRTGLASADHLRSATSLDVIPLLLIDPAFYHLDTCFFPLTRDTAFYYPPAFDTTAVKSLTIKFVNLIPLTSDEAGSFVCNSVMIGNTVLCQPCPTFEQKVIALGFTPHTLKMHEFNKSGGGIHCLSQIPN